MKSPTLHGRIVGLLLAGALAASSPARAEILPWLTDPFGAQKKADAFGNKLRPAHCPGVPDPNQPLKLNQTVLAALCHNPDSKAAYLSLVAAADTYAQSYSPYLPTIDASANLARSTTFTNSSKLTALSKSPGLSASLLLYDFGQREFNVEIAEQALAASGHSYDALLQGLVATAMQSYYVLLTSQNAVEVSHESEGFAKASHDAATLRHKLGLVPLADVLQAKGSYSQAQLATQQAENALAQAQASLASLLGLSADAPLSVEELDDSYLMQEPFDGEVKALMEKAKSERVDLQATRAGLKGAEASLRSLERSQLGSISAGVDTSIDDDGFFNGNTTRSQAIGISVSIPIFTGFSDTYARHGARKSLEAQEKQLVRAELNVEQDVWRAWQNYQTAKESWEVTWDQLATATQLKDVALGRYKEGIGTILDVLNAQLQYSNALQSQLQTRYNLLATRVDLVRAVGVLNLDSLDAASADNAKTDNLPTQGSE